MHWQLLFKKLSITKYCTYKIHIRVVKTAHFFKPVNRAKKRPVNHYLLKSACYKSVLSRSSLQPSRLGGWQCSADCCRGRPRTRIRSFFCRRGRSADQSFIDINLLSSGRMYPAEKQTMQLHCRPVRHVRVQCMSAQRE